MLQDDCYSFDKIAAVFKEADVENVIKQRDDACLNIEVCAGRGGRSGVTRC